MRSLFYYSPSPITTLFQLVRSHLRFCSTTNPMVIPQKSSPAAVIPTEDRLATRLWFKFRRESMLSLYSPFTLCLASGSLKIDTFRRYIAQDAHFLKAFARAYELSEDCADDDDAKLAISALRKGALEELKMHNSFVQEWGSDCVKECPVNSATLKYTEFLLATASGKVEGLKSPGTLATPFEKTKIAAYTLGAMTPCMRLYAFLGKEFQALLESSEHDHPYKKWIENYSSESFQASALQTEDLLDKLSVPLTGEELNIIEKLYHQAMKLEIEFFYSQPLTQPTIAPLTKEHASEQDRLMIFSDFDLTCTVVDSSAILAEIAIVTAQKSDQNQPAGQIIRMSSAEPRNTWGQLSTQYTEEYEHCIESILPSEKVEFNYETLHKALEQLSDFEKRANSRVIVSGVLKGLNLEDIKRAGERMILQDGCINFFQKITQNKSLNANVHVISYCWCGDLIRTAFSSGGLDALNIHANEFSFAESLSTGEIVWKVQSPIDKIQAFDDILQDCSNDRKNLSVYIGDSVGDLLCLVKADIGIVVGSCSSLRRVGSQYGVSFVPLFPGLVKKQKEFAEGRSPRIWKGQSGILYTASSWDDIHGFILGL
ncbi:putative aminopyrimidine aminohydrolase [Hibiscus syriacus]|uniref:Aminopyrimidine aminohydrolase n=1 Tax=Hibiscus syriacus TaxID=106335 RepID=A0A6A2YY64_HIBSY|nr:bifunctional TH2 protein, mitochondrial-like isoform X2 [Hibiscus syriacus]KAE8684227.1 putative aminopyrimidine aminohydrolase [Hibiscus syriacus]